MKKILLSLFAMVAGVAGAMADDFSITSAEIVSGKSGTVELGSNAYGSQSTTDNTTWYTFAKSGFGFTGCKICQADGTNGVGIQMQGNASTATKQGFLGNTTAFGAISQIVVKVNTISTSTCAPSFNVCVGSSELPTTAVTLPDATTDTKTVSEKEYKTYTYTISVTDGSTYFAIRNNLAGALYIDEIDVTYTGSGVATCSAPTLTAGGVFTADSYDVTITNNEYGSKVYYTTDGSDPDITKITALSFTGDSKTLTINKTTTVKAMAVLDGKENSSIASATYTKEKSIANTLETAYTTAQAIALIDAGSSRLTSTMVYVKGKVSKVDSYNSTYGSITYWLDDNAFEVYGGLNNNGEKFASKDDVKTGAEVVVYGIIKKYGTTYEFDKNNWLVQYTAPAKPEPTLTLSTYSTSLQVGATEKVSATYTGDGTLTVTSSDPEVASVNLTDVDAEITALKAGTTTITFSLSETDSYQAKSVSYTLTVTAPVTPAAVPFEFDGGVADITADKGMTQNGIDKDYSSSPKLKFNTTGDYLIINIASEAKYLHYTIKGNGNTTTPGAVGQYDVLESADGVDYSTVKSYTELNTGDDKDAIVETNLSLKSDTRYIKFIYTTKSSGNVALGAIKINNEEATGISQLSAQDSQLSSGKFVENGRLVVVKNGKRFNMAGQTLKQGNLGILEDLEILETLDDPSNSNKTAVPLKYEELQFSKIISIRGEKRERTMNFTGLVIAVATFFVIGAFHPIVIKTEYYFGVKVWWLFLILGLAFIAMSLFLENQIGSTILGVIGCSCMWSILELFEQRERVRKGWFPKNPKRK